MPLTDRRSHENQGNRRLYQCDVCEYLAPWGKGWQWYGSYADIEYDPKSLPVFCSEKCKRSAEAKKLIAEIKGRKYRRGPAGVELKLAER